MNTPVAPAALSQVDYLQEKLYELEALIRQVETDPHLSPNVLKDLYFQKGKVYSQMELMKRVTPY